jgi:hypothetical protein
VLAHIDSANKQRYREVGPEVYNFVLDTQTVLQIIALIGTGVGAAKFIDTKIDALRKEINERLDRCPIRNECDSRKREVYRRFESLESSSARFQEHVYNRVGEIAQKAQIIVSRKDLRSVDDN